MISEIETNKQLLDQLFAAINDGDFAPLEPHPGFHETRQYVPMMRTFFTDWRTTFMQQIAEGEVVFSYGAVEFTHSAPFAGVQPTGKRVYIEVLSFDEVHDGIVIEHNSASSWADVLHQLDAPAFAQWPARSPQPLSQGTLSASAATRSANKAAVAQLLDALSSGEARQGLVVELADRFADMRAAFPDLALTPVLQVAEGDLVATRATLHGTQNGAIYGIPASGRALSWDFFMLARVVDGTVVEQYSAADWNSVLMKLGLLAF